MPRSQLMHRHGSLPVDLDPAHDALSPKRAIIWEVNMVRQFLKNFSKVINAHAIVMSLLVTVTFVGLLQPPKGWQVVNSGEDSYLYASRSMTAFVVFNSFSLFSAIAGLLFYIYCSYSTIFTLGSVPVPDKMDEHGMEIVRKLRYILRRVAIPSLQRRSKILFIFLSSSLVCCVGAYICAGAAAIGPSKGLGLAVIVPAIGGCAVIVLFLLLSAAKMCKELEFKERLELFSEIITSKEINYENMDEKIMRAVDPMPNFLLKFILSWRSHKKKVTPTLPDVDVDAY